MSKENGGSRWLLVDYGQGNRVLGKVEEAPYVCEIDPAKLRLSSPVIVSMTTVPQQRKNGQVVLATVPTFQPVVPGLSPFDRNLTVEVLMASVNWTCIVPEDHVAAIRTSLLQQGGTVSS